MGREDISRKEWVDPPFCLSEVNGEPSLSTNVIRGCLPEGCGAGRSKKAAISP